ncbi:MAG: glycosyltransferase family 4 protein [Lachnospiraceae bacterium]|nr:glycosyltransferase family 4 protein [Lachnospiraceae bacterium]
MNMIKVGYWDQTYAEQRLIVQKENVGKVQYIPIDRSKDDWMLNLVCSLDTFRKDLFPNRKGFYYHPVGTPKCDLIHNFNGVCDMKLPWFSSYETRLPKRLKVDLDKPVNKWWLKYNCELLAKDHCKGLFPISRSAYEIEQAYIKRYAEEYYDDIMKKTEVVHPPQAEIVTESMIQEKNETILKKIEFIFVGTGFWFKGGKEAVEALAKFRKDYDFHLTIVSDFLVFPEREPQYTKEDYRQAMKLIHENRDWITLYNKLSNRRVLKLCAESHVGVLPSYADSYGYACLEFQASGCPVITSDIRAFSEINGEEYGYVYRIDPAMSSKEKQENNLRCLIGIFEEIFNHPEEIAKKGRRSLERIREMHSPQKYADFMLEKYRQALKQK